MKAQMSVKRKIKLSEKNVKRILRENGELLEREIIEIKPSGLKKGRKIATLNRPIIYTFMSDSFFDPPREMFVVTQYVYDDGTPIGGSDFGYITESTDRLLTGLCEALTE